MATEEILIRSAVIESERQTYERMWEIPQYAVHAPGVAVLPIFLQCAASDRAHSRVLDVGTGTGKGALALRAEGFEVECFDLTDAGLVDEARSLPFHAGTLWQPLPRAADGGPWDYIYCTDVLEHVPTAFTMLAVRRMLEASRIGVFLSISNVPDQCGAWIGERLHQTVQPYVWWRDNLRALGMVLDSRDLIGMSTFYLWGEAR